MRKYFFITLFIFIWLCACGDCEKSAQSYKNDNIEIILTEQPYIYGDMKFIGTKINSKESFKIIMEGRWYRNYRSYMEIGDTVIKRRRELTMYIHKKDTTLVFKWECEGKVYE